MLSGQVQVFFGPIQSSVEYIRTGKLRALGATTAKRIAALPDLPTIAEFVPGYEAEGWLGIGATKNTPADAIAKLNAGINAAIADKDIVSKLANLGDAPFPSSVAEFTSFVTAETDKWGKVIRSANIKIEQ
jgi:tripartite-type tricarboxylate transporter receptor subunit TctC